MDPFRKTPSAKEDERFLKAGRLIEIYLLAPQLVNLTY
jgi:hypothetical protein